MTTNRIYLLSNDDAVAFICESEWGFAEIDADGNFAWMNQAYCRLLNAPLELTAGTPATQWTHVEDVDIFAILSAKVKAGEIPGFTLSKRYIQRGSTPQRQLVIWGILSATGKWNDGKFVGLRVQFRQYDPMPNKPSWNLAHLSSAATTGLQWAWVNWRAIVTVGAVGTSLILSGSGKLLETLQRAKEVKQSVDSALDSLSPGALPPPSSSPTESSP